jgi:hypothetical protein
VSFFAKHLLAVLIVDDERIDLSTGMISGEYTIVTVSPRTKRRARRRLMRRLARQWHWRYKP